MVGLAPDDGAQRDERIEISGLREPLQRERRFQGAGHADHGDVALADAGFFQRTQRACEHQIADAGIEARQDDADTPAEAVGVYGKLADRHERWIAVARRRCGVGL